MTNENETVEQVCEKYQSVMPIPKDEILAAHKREIADFQRRYDECVRRFNEADLERVRLRDEVASKDAELDRSEREYISCREELRATRERRDDCEVKMRKALERVTRAENALAAKDAEITKRDALVKELTDALSQSVINHCYRCKFFRLKHTECKDKKNEVKCWSKSFKELIAKAREVLNG